MTAVLQAHGVSVAYRGGGRTQQVVDGVSFSVERGCTLGIIGESGAGKSTLARAIVGLEPLAAGRITVDGTDIAHITRRERNATLRRLQMVFQDPFASLNPRMTVEKILTESLGYGHGKPARSERARRVDDLLRAVSLRPNLQSAYPAELSGGQRQRVAIARALAVEPDVLVADEITSALDISAQGAIINLLKDIQRTHGLTIVFVSHNIAIVRHISDHLAVMKDGRIVESGTTDEVIRRPQNLYTRQLLASVPRLRPGRSTASATRVIGTGYAS